MPTAPVPEPSTTPVVTAAAWRDLDPGTLHDLVRLRVDVFVVEQRCPYPELDGRDVEPATLHLWTCDPAGPTAYLRLLTDDDGPQGLRRIGRVATRGDARGQGLSTALLREALRRSGTRTVVLDAQAHLVDFYRRFGFSPTGPEYLDDGIPHVPMRRTGDVAAPG